MNRSIVDTNVILNLAVSKSLWLLPSNMIILKKPVQGYNNKLKVAGSEMNFGVNKSLNKMIPKIPRLTPIVEKHRETPVSKEKITPNETHTETTNKDPSTEKSNTSVSQETSYFLLAIASLYLFSKYIF